MVSPEEAALPGEESTSSADEPGPVLQFKGLYSVQIYEAGAAGAYQFVGFQQPGNCILIEGNPFILNGTATARWDASTVSPMELAFGIAKGEAIEAVAAEPGAGVAQLRFENLEVDGDGWLSWQVSRRGLAGASPGTPAEVELVFEYRLPDSEQGLAIDPGYSCSIEP